MLLCQIMSLLPPAKEVGGKVMFLHVSVILFIGLGGGWLPSMHHRSHEQPPGGGGWLPSMHHWSHDQEVCIQEREGVCIGGGLHPDGWALHPGKGSASRGGVCIQGKGSASTGRGLYPGGLHGGWWVGQTPCTPHPTYATGIRKAGGTLATGKLSCS